MLPEDAGMKKKKRKLEAGKEARRRARKAGLTPGATRVIEDKRSRREKHKKKWMEEES
jgi:molybdopterin biosynthesis enzyme MoaB